MWVAGVEGCGQLVWECVGSWCGSVWVAGVGVCG